MNQLHVWWRELFGSFIGTVVDDIGETPGDALYRLWTGLGYPAAFVELAFTRLASRIDTLQEELGYAEKDQDKYHRLYTEQLERDMTQSRQLSHEQLTREAELAREARQLRDVQEVLKHFAHGYPTEFWSLMTTCKRIQAVKCLRDASRGLDGEARFGLLALKQTVDALSPWRPVNSW